MTAKKAPRNRRRAPIVELIVRRGALRRFDKLKRATADLPVKISWDRRIEPDERAEERRRKPPFTWDAADFVVVNGRKRRR